MSLAPLLLDAESTQVQEETSQVLKYLESEGMLQGFIDADQDPRVCVGPVYDFEGLFTESNSKTYRDRTYIRFFWVRNT